jgi:beta-ureidopropionase / N-carbamoyl-L-amino-acid hydrolase
MALHLGELPIKQPIYGKRTIGEAEVRLASMEGVAMVNIPVQPQAVRVNGARLLELVDELATYGMDPAGGVSRLAFTPADNAARRFLADLAKCSGLHPYIDEAGNLIIRTGERPSRRPQMLLGSHLDTVRRGGRLDGAYGVVAALEVLRTLVEQGINPRFEPVLVAFANEEGTLFQLPFWGSRAMTGQLDRPDLVADKDGNSIRQPLAQAGGNLDRIEAATWPHDSIAAYLELHVEQGPVLESKQVPIGIVDAIVGRTVFEIQVQGKQNHAGTTPMDCRTDALVAAAHIVLGVESIAKDRSLCAVSTVGVLESEPNQTNVIPGRATLVAEIRDGQPDRLNAAESAVYEALAAVELETGVQVQTKVAMRCQPTGTNPELQSAIAASAETLGLTYMTISSGAGHDAQIVARIAPIGMIFVPSKGGVSHAPEEDTADRHLVAGASLLASVAASIG